MCILYLMWHIKFLLFCLQDADYKFSRESMGLAKLIIHTALKHDEMFVSGHLHSALNVTHGHCNIGIQARHGYLTFFGGGGTFLANKWRTPCWQHYHFHQG